MKKQCFAVCFAALITCAVSAQETVTYEDTTVYAPIQLRPPNDTGFYKPLPEGATPPSFRGGEQGLMQLLASRISYPKQAITNNIQGIVALSFVVEKDGSISNIVVLRDIGGGCAEESVRVVKTLPKWLPGMIDGSPVRVSYVLPVRFKLDKPEKPKKKKFAQRDSLFGN